MYEANSNGGSDNQTLTGVMRTIYELIDNIGFRFTVYLECNDKRQ